VLANPHFGMLVSEAGSGMTWAQNSRMHALTPWSNDPLADPPGEWLLLHDVERDEVWPLARTPGDGRKTLTHGIGFTRMQQRVAGLEVTLTWCVDAELPVRQLQLSIENGGERARSLRLVALVEWQLGGARFERQSVDTRAETLPLGPRGVGLPAPPRARVLLATQLDPTGGFGDSTAFLAWRLQDGTRPDGWTCDRREFFDAAGHPVLPTALGRRAGLGLDPCGAVACIVTLAPGAVVGATLLLGHATRSSAALDAAAQALAVDPVVRLQRQRAQWPERLGSVRVATPDPLFDALVNHWLPYQTVASRLWARAGFYQAGGAYGFRDQLQDAMNLVAHDPSLLAQQIRRHAARQFPEGDVQHWWHEPGGAGVRTHFSDDLLWLPLALALYVERSGDTTLLDETLPFLAGGAVPPGREDLYETPQPQGDAHSLYEHGARAIDHSLRTGAHGLPLMGTGDWNDGMNRIGPEGRGESVWLGWFLCDVVQRYLPLAAALGDDARVQAWATARQGWVAALDAAGWDGHWYRRAFFDDGTPLGSAANAEARIDLIAQAFAVLSGAGDPQRAATAMASVRSELFDAKHALLPLLTPPLQHATPSAGYIQAYPPGVRENGGQYNHAAVWGLMAFARLGRAEDAWHCFEAISPAHRWRDPERGASYAIEPYVLAGDVYTVAPHIGRGGWSWYTGAAGWLLRAAVESLCGVLVARGEVTLAPCLPPHWDEATVELRCGALRHRFVLCRDDAALARAHARDAAAERVRPPGPVRLHELVRSTVFIVDARPDAAAAARSRASVVDRGARQYQLEQGALAFLRPPDE
ncbi:MAG: carbohydrate-binding protein, partial [Rubrivivax sp.]